MWSCEEGRRTTDDGRRTTDDRRRTTDDRVTSGKDHRLLLIISINSYFFFYSTTYIEKSDVCRPSSVVLRLSSVVPSIKKSVVCGPWSVVCSMRNKPVHRQPVLQASPQRHFIRIFQFAAEGDAAGDGCNPAGAGL